MYTIFHFKNALIELKTQINTNTLIGGDFNDSLPPGNRLSRQKINREASNLNYIIHQMKLIDINKIFYPNTKEYIVYSEAHKNFSKMGHILGHKEKFPN